MINARVDALRLPGDPGELFEEAVLRGQRFLAAGADCVFPIRLADQERIGDFVQRVGGKVNVVAAGAPPLAELARLGVARVSLAGTLMNRVYATLDAALSELAADAAAIS